MDRMNKRYVQVPFDELKIWQRLIWISYFAGLVYE